MTKSERNELRRLEALRRDMPQRLIAFSVLVANAWLEPGHKVEDISYAEIDVTPEEKRYISRQWEKILKHRDDMIRRLGLNGMYYRGKKNEEQARCKAFFRSVDDMIMLLEDGIRRHLPDGSHTDQLRILTYLLYTAFHDWWVMHPEESARDIRYLVQTLGTFCNREISQDSELVVPLNQIYWETWSALFHDEAGCIYLDELADLQSAQERYIRTTPSPIMRRLNDEVRWEKLKPVEAAC